MRHLLAVALVLLAFVVNADATVYEVRPGTPLDSIAEVPWATLQPGDTVLIYWRADPYTEKWVVGRSGTAAQPITIRGVPGPNGELPVIDGRNATTPPGLNFWSENRGVIKIGGSNIPDSTYANYIVIENLEIRSGHPSNSYTNDSGAIETYSTSASSIYIERGENITVRNCKLHDSANGFFVASGDDGVSRNILVEGNYIVGNGVVGSIFQHNNYTAAVNITFQYNRFGPPRAGAPGVNLKDRSAGLVVRYNWIEGGNRNLDLVDGEDSAIIRNAPEYRKTLVYGNVFIKQDGGNNQSVHYGGDSGTTADYRKGKLYFYNNTLYSIRAGTTVVMRLSTNEETCDARNNIFFNTSAGSNLALLAESGTLTVANNWAKTGWRNSHEGAFNGSVAGGATMVTGSAPGFVDGASQDFRLMSSSPAINAGTALHADVLPTYDVVRQYLQHQSSVGRPVNGVFDIGAFEFLSVAPMQISTTSLPNGLRGRSYIQQLQASGGSGNYLWSVTSGSLPAGVVLDPTTGILRGRPKLKGNSTFTITVQDAQNPAQTASLTFTITTFLHMLL
jgi:hypothetical protein